MATRKPPPTHIYREEIHGAEPGYNSTRQTFDEKKFNDWKKGAERTRAVVDARLGWERRFYVGVIDWKQVHG